MITAMKNEDWRAGATRPLVLKKIGGQCDDARRQRMVARFSPGRQGQNVLPKCLRASPRHGTGTPVDVADLQISPFAHERSPGPNAQRAMA